MPTDKRTDLVTVGSADIFINQIDVGHLKDRIEYSHNVEKLLFKPANMLGNVKAFAIREAAQVRARTAQLNVANIRLALGVTTTVSASTTPSGIPASASFTPSSGSSWDILTIGGAKETREFGLRLEHTRPDGNMVVILFYKATTNSELLLPFAEDEFTLHDITFEALADATRSEGDQIGQVLIQVN